MEQVNFTSCSFVFRFFIFNFVFLFMGCFLFVEIEELFAILGFSFGVYIVGGIITNK